MTNGTKLRDALDMPPGPHRGAVIRSAISVGIAECGVNHPLLDVKEACHNFAPQHGHLSREQDEALQALANFFDTKNLDDLSGLYAEAILASGIGL
ncbi:hypothetical protein P3C22_11620 [Pseudomonas sp. ER28]|uniref:hypothetical protein n=1 Tax=Pseudomonas TaxID=286 RepID=UPI00221E6E0D|nr:hypothetical protein [Pseudomonas sp. ER28]MDF3172692.1 hypothetical protein [Pseudomonas sp. ER28]CAI3803639.1 hypothetical protein DBADOPDK_03344 [Pseudomonas sp. MM223]CAI3804158.1 hypothetical protein GLGCALEP_03418 [Pseudomonas sp. MM221]